MLVRTDPFRELDRVASQVLGTAARPAVMPMDAWRDGDTFVIEFDLPAVDPDSVDIDVERNVLTVRAERLSPTAPDVELVASERPRRLQPTGHARRVTRHRRHPRLVPVRSAPSEPPGGRAGQATQDPGQFGGRHPRGDQDLTPLVTGTGPAASTGCRTGEDRASRQGAEAPPGESAREPAVGIEPTT